MVEKYRFFKYECEDNLYIEVTKRLEINDIISPSFKVYYRYKDNKWIDSTQIILDRLYGFDETEPEGSPFRFGNYDRDYEMIYISKEEAKQMINNKINIDELL